MERRALRLTTGQRSRSALARSFWWGTPKQAIYRFRGADVSAYVQAREAFKEQAPDSLLAISTNFRSCSSILTYVNERFQGILSSPGQPGFTALEAFHGERETPCVAALNIAAAGADGKSSSEQQRDAEAEAVADLCARLIGSQPVADRNGTAPDPASLETSLSSRPPGLICGVTNKR